MERTVGTDIRRPEGPDKVSGRAVFVADLATPGAWFGGTVRSDVPRGELLGVDLDPAFDWDRVRLAGPAEVPGANVVAMINEDMPVLAEREVRHVGQPLLLVAAPDAETLGAALAAARPRIAPLPAVLDMEDAPEVLHEILIEKGDAPSALARAARIIEGTYRTDTQEQMYIEPQGVIAWPPDASGCTVVRGSMQCPFYVHKSLVTMLGTRADAVRVIQVETGGGFGGKEDYPSVLACHAVLLARAAGVPVRMIYDRHEDLAVTPKRHPSRVRHRTSVADDGTLLAMDIDVLLDGGAYTTLSPVVLSRACIHAAGAYRCDHVRIRGRVVRTDHVPYGAFRGFGAPQVCFAVERQMDRIAGALALHPAELRRKNMLRVGDTTATGQRLETSVGSVEVMERVLARSRFDRHAWRSAGVAREPHDSQGARKRTGVGFSFFFHGAGFTGSGEELLKARVRVELDQGGRAVVETASTEFGQGTIAMFTALAADALGAAPEDIRIAAADTSRVPNSGPTVASRTCMVVGGCVMKACAELRARMSAASGDESGPFADRARAFLAGGGDGLAEVVYASPPGLVWDEEHYRGDAYPAYGWAADVAEVEVDLDTFEVRVTRFLSTVDVGKAIQPQLVEGQIEGGSLQAIGFAHLEVVTTEGGRFLQDRMATCIIPGTLDTPPIEVELVEVPFPHGPAGAKGVGELPMDGGAPAVASAIEDALGIHVDHIPATPERLLDAWLRAHPEEAL